MVSLVPMALFIISGDLNIFFFMLWLNKSLHVVLVFTDMIRCKHEGGHGHLGQCSRKLLRPNNGR